MIPISISLFLLVYLGMMLILIFFLWMISHIRARKKNSLIPYLKFRQCEFCLHPFLIKPEKKFHRCPQCNCLFK